MINPQFFQQVEMEVPDKGTNILVACGERLRRENLTSHFNNFLFSLISFFFFLFIFGELPMHPFHIVKAYRFDKANLKKYA